MKKDLDYYRKLNWTYRFEWSDKDGAYIGSVAELPGCITDGETIEEAVAMMQDALNVHIESMLEDGDIIPEPPKQEEYKGTITYRTTPEKHYKLAKKAKAHGKSINKYIDEIISKDIA